MPDRLVHRLRLAVLALVVFVLGHDLLYLATYRAQYDRIMAETGHGLGWTSAVAIVTLLAVGLTSAGALRLIVLARQARAVRAARLVYAPANRYRVWRGFLSAAITVFAVSSVIFLGWENVERVLAGGVAPGLAVLGAATPAAIPVFIALSIGAAIVETIYRWRRDLLVARIASARAAIRHPRVVRVPWPAMSPLRLRTLFLGRHVAGRAPPPHARSAARSVA